MLQAMISALALLAAATSPAAAVVTLPGVQYQVVRSGPADGGHPNRYSVVRVRYEGRLADGTLFDSSKDAPDGAVEFPLARLIPGWGAVVPLMRPGDEWILRIPPQYAYGAAGKAPAIPPNATLEFRIELLGFQDAPPPKP